MSNTPAILKPDSREQRLRNLLLCQGIQERPASLRFAVDEGRATVTAVIEDQEHDWTPPTADVMRKIMDSLAADAGMGDDDQAGTLPMTVNGLPYELALRWEDQAHGAMVITSLAPKADQP